MRPVRIYLDQFAWIELARVHYGLDTTPARQELLRILEHSSNGGIASFPLSANHYLETYRHGNPQRRQRLGRFMAHLSGFHTIVGPNDVLPDEICAAIRRIAGLEPVSPKVEVFGRGHAHAFGATASYKRDEELWQSLVGACGETLAFAMLEEALLAGPAERLPFEDIKIPTRAVDQRQLTFEQDTARILQTEGHSADLARRLVLAQETTAMLAELDSMAASLRMDLHTLLPTDAAWTQFVLSMPAKGAITRMRYESHANPAFKRGSNDLGDVTALGMAAAYCDVVVAEAHWGSLMQRFPEQFHARIVTGVVEIADVLPL